MADLLPIPYRIRIGVTGHRTLPDARQIHNGVRMAIEKLLPQLLSESDRRKLVRHRQLGTLAYTALSPLAEGADRVVARAVLEDADGRLDVVLPFDAPEYMKDFATEDSRREFETLLGRCRRPVVLANNPSGDDSRPAAYEAAGQYVVDHCDVLIAIWDGEKARGRGGTAEIVEYAGQQSRPILRVWGEAAELYAKGHGLQLCALDSLERFNTTAVSGREESGCRAGIAPYFSHPLIATLAVHPRFQKAREMVDAHLIPFYLRASALAARSQRRFYRAGYAIYLFSAAAVIFAALGHLIRALDWKAFSVELLLLLTAFYLERRSRSRNSHQFWMDNRFLAERIRCGVFLALCGVDPEPIVIPPFMGHAQSLNDWPVRAFDEIWNRLPRLVPCTSAECLDISKYVGETWVGGQVEYHTRKSESEKTARERLELVVDVLVPLTILAAALHVAHGLIPTFGLQERFEDLLTGIALGAPAIAAGVAGVQAFREHRRLEKRSASMVPHLQALKSRMQAVKDPNSLAGLLGQVDELMLRESQDWLMLMRDVEIKGG